MKLGNNFDKTANKQLRCLDIGCGTGDFTRDVLLYHISPSSSIVAVDVSSQMIGYAKEHSQHPNVAYEILDIATPDVSDFVSKHEKFDRVYSFYCLQWVQDQDAALRNIATLMKSGGEFLLLFPVKTAVYTIWRDIAKLPRWKAYTGVSTMSCGNRFYLCRTQYSAE